MGRNKCNKAATDILNLFGFQSMINFSIGGFNGDLDVLLALVKEWWKHYKAWEAEDTLENAFKEQRLTVKGTTTMNENIQAHIVPAGLNERYQRDDWGPSTTFNTPIVKTNSSIKARLDPSVFRPGGSKASRKTELGYHDLSALLLNPAKKISEQQFKGRNDIKPDQIYVFMPLSFAIDQAVFQNINTLAKIHQDDHRDFYEKVIEIRSEMTRIKLAAEHDMATAFVKVPRPKNPDLPKFQYAFLQKSDASIRDQAAGLIPSDTFRMKMTVVRIENAIKEASPPFFTNAGDIVRFSALITSKLSSFINKDFGEAELRRELNQVLTLKKLERDLVKFKSVANEQSLEKIKDAILLKSSEKSKQVLMTPALHQARQNAALNFQSLILGQIMRYAEITIAYRQHGTPGVNKFPIFARFDKTRNSWIVVDVGDDNRVKDRDPEQTFKDFPV